MGFGETALLPRGKAPAAGLCSVLAEELFGILNETDDHHHGRARKADQEQEFKGSNCQSRQHHALDCNPVFALRRLMP